MAIAVSMGQSERVAQYEVPDDELAIGSTLGSPTAVCVLKASGALEKVYSTDIGKELFGSFLWRAYDRRSGMALARRHGGKFLLHPEHQEHHFTLDGSIAAAEDVFVLNSAPDDAGGIDPPGVYYCVTLTNQSDEPAEIALYAYCELRGKTEHDVVAEYDAERNALVVWNESASEQVRLLGCSVKPNSYEVSQNAGRVVASHCPGPLPDTLARVHQPLGALYHTFTLQPGGSQRVVYLMSFGKGRAEAEANYDRCPDAEIALDRTRSHFHGVLRRAVLFTPSEEVNRGVLWAKANMLRILIKAGTGWGFVNDPTRSNNSVARDTAWFAFGADYLRPEFSRASLMAYVHNQEKDGLVVEYYDLRTGKTADYNLNINDNTPLLILGLWHHYNTTGDKEFLREIYPAAKKAAACILSQRNAQGLVWCTATGTSDWGIVGWRNVISNYRLLGATTELNSECYAALKTAAHMARVLEKPDDCAAFQNEAEALKEAINTHLRNPDNGLYYLNIDLDGVPRSDVTSDLVFPVMYEVADDETCARIVSRLSEGDFWTRAGIRTTPRNAIDYNPDGTSNGPYGLLGGVWVGVSFWFAFAAARYNPEFMELALSNSFRNYSMDPRRNNTVPGQFSEWLHGETLVNQGMMLSPWFAPRYLWAAIEGAAGLNMSGDELALNPRLAPHWKWLGVRNLPYRGQNLAWLAVRLPELSLYTTFALPASTQQSVPLQAYDTDITDQVQARGSDICVLGLGRGEDLLLFAGSTADETVTTSVRVQADLSGSYRLRQFDSLLGVWQDQGVLPASRFEDGYVLQIERKGFSLLELTKSA